MNSIRLVLLMVARLYLTMCHFETTSKNSCEHEKLSPKIVNKDLVSAVKVIIEEVFSTKFTTVNIITATKGSEQHRSNDLMTAILIQNREKYAVRLDGYMNIVPIKTRLKAFNMFLLDGIETFRVLNNQLTPNYFKFSGFYLFVLINGKSVEHDEIFETLWKRHIFNVNLIYQDVDAVSVMTFMPFTRDTRCGNTKAVLVDQFVNGSFQGSLDSLFPSKFRNLQNCPIKVVTFEENLAVFRDETLNGTYELRGYDMDLLNVLSSSLNFKKEMKFLTIRLPWGYVLPNGTVTGALAELQKETQQIAIGDYYLKPNRLNVLESSVTYYSFPLVFVIPSAANSSAFRKLLQPFRRIVWVLLLATFLCGLLVIFLINIRLKRLRSFVYGTGVKHPVTNMLIVIFGSSQPKLPRRNFSRFLLMMFSIFCLVQRGIYQGSLYIFLQSDGLEKEMETLDEMIENDFEFTIFESNLDIFEDQPGIQKR